MDVPTSAAPAFAPRTVQYDDGRQVVIRASRTADVDGLRVLSTTLPQHDRYLRFFTGSTPPARVFEDEVHADERGGFALVAADATGCIVGDAWYARLPNGDGELAIAVDPAWRGGLGTALLDALRDAAAARGVADLEAEVLLENGPMLRMLHDRGAMTVGEPEGSSVRVVIGTDGCAPGWAPADPRPRVLVEVPHGRWRATAAAQRAGLQVRVCSGPTNRRGGPCPLLAGGRCPMADGADAIVTAAAGDTAALVGAHHHEHAHVPLFVELTPAELDQGFVPPGTATLAGRTADEAAAAIARVAAGAARDPRAGDRP